MSTVEKRYKLWRSRFVKRWGDRIYIDYNQNHDQEPRNAVTCSEAIGYGMLISVLMKNQGDFDGLLRWFIHFRNDKDLCSWQQVKSGGSFKNYSDGGDSSATDGDIDIATALFYASHVWGKSADGRYDYRTEAVRTAKAIWEHDINHFTYLPTLGDWVEIKPVRPRHSKNNNKNGSAGNTDSKTGKNKKDKKEDKDKKKKKEKKKDPRKKHNRHRHGKDHGDEDAEEGDDEEGEVVEDDDDVEVVDVKRMNKSKSNKKKKSRKDDEDDEEDELVEDNEEEEDEDKRRKGKDKGKKKNKDDDDDDEDEDEDDLKEEFVEDPEDILTEEDEKEGNDQSDTESQIEVVEVDKELGKIDPDGFKHGESDMHAGATRPSDFILAGFLTFYHEDLDRTKEWARVMDAVVNTIQHNLKLNPSTGLMADFLRIAKNGQYEPHRKQILESPNDKDYNWNSCRIPWRLSVYYLLTHDPRVLPTLQAEANFFGSQKEVYAGYHLNGKRLSGRNYGDMAFTAPASMCMWLTRHANYAKVQKQMEELESDKTYFGDSIQLLCLLQAQNPRGW